MNAPSQLVHEVECPTQRDIVRFLHSTRAYPDRPAAVDVVETHISWVFLTDRFAYKLKKQVRFDFLDFSTKELREEACREELRLNRRLAREAYLDVVPVSLRGNRLHLGPGGKVLDWVVKMRRLPADRALDHLVNSRILLRGDVDRIAQTLADFYVQLPPVSLKTDEYVDEITHHVHANEQELLQPSHGLDACLVERIHEALRRYVTLFGDVLQSRVVDGRIVEGHGDLRPEHVYLTHHSVVIDCIEFNREYRILDAADELSFFNMECAKLDAQWIGQRVFESYRNSTGDNPPAALIAFYSAYRACVRAKVSVLRAEQLAGGQRDKLLRDGRDYLNLADEFARAIGPPLLIVVRGLSGTGKSTLAAAVARRLGITRLQTDAIRREMLGNDRHTAAYGEGCYDHEGRQLVYNDMLRRAGALLAQGRSVVLDGTFLSSTWRKRAIRAANQHTAIPVFIRCECPDDVVVRRIAARGAIGHALSEASEETHRRQKSEDEPDPPGIRSTSLKTTKPLPRLLETVLREITASYANSSR